MHWHYGKLGTNVFINTTLGNLAQLHRLNCVGENTTSGDLAQLRQLNCVGAIASAQLRRLNCVGSIASAQLRRLSCVSRPTFCPCTFVFCLANLARKRETLDHGKLGTILGPTESYTRKCTLRTTARKQAPQLKCASAQLLRLSCVSRPCSSRF